MSDTIKRIVQALRKVIDAPSGTEQEVLALADGIAALKDYDEQMSDPARPILIDLARETPMCDGYTLQVDDDALTSATDDGSWVQAWIFLESMDSDDEDRDDA